MHFKNNSASKKIKRGFALCAIIFFIFSSPVFCQTNYIPNIIPPSPNASTLTKFSDVPVSPYTGTADVSIPIYTIQARGIEVPIGLDYHTGGIKLKEESGWVGLGWALNAGGSISRTIMGLDDFGGEYFNTSVPDITANLVVQPPLKLASWGGNSPANALGIFGYDFFCNYTVYTDQGTKDFSNAFQSPTPFDDFEPDIFSYNFSGRSGKFIIDRSGKVILQKQDNIIVQYASDGSSFTITDDKGNKFYFLDREFTKSTSGGPQAASSWMLSRIVTQQNDSVNFTYFTDNTWTDVAGDPYEILRNGCAPNNQPNFGTSIPNAYLNLTLQTIDFANGEIQFSFDAIRNDLEGGKKLNSIKIFSKNAAGTLTYIKENQFSYSYFNGGETFASTLEGERLRLDSVKEVSNGVSLPPYSFIYNLPDPSYVQLTAKHSYHVDHWGYYNGYLNGLSQFTPEFNGFTTIPAVGGTEIPSFLFVPGANREPDINSMQAFSLQQVNYPTGGQTVFQYEPNYYDDNTSRGGLLLDFPQMHLVDTPVSFVITARGTSNGSIDLSKIFLTQYLDPNINFTVTFRSQTNVSQPIYRNNNGKIYFTFNSTNVDMSQTTGLSCGINTCTTGKTEFEVPAKGVYNWTAYIDPSIGSDFEGIYITFNWQEQATDHYNNPTWIASGLRIKTVTDYSASGSVAKKRRYDYGYLADKGFGIMSYTYGRLISYPQYARLEPTIVTIGPTNADPNQTASYQCNLLTRTSSSNSAITSSMQGNIVGYDQVAEYNVDPISGIDIGKTVYQYYNTSDTAIYYLGYRLPGLLNFGNNLNGLLSSKSVYQNSGNGYFKVTETDNSYHTTNRIVYLNMKYYYVPATGSISGCPVSSVQNQFLACFYPSIKSERILLDQTTDILYDQNDPTKKIVTTKNFYYNNPAHYQITLQNSLDSKGNIITTKFSYPQDYILTGQTMTNNTILDAMIRKNMVSETIEKQEGLYYPGSSTGYITGAQLSLYKILSANNNTIVPDKIYKLDLQSPVTDFQPFSFNGNTTTMDTRNRQMISFDQYDTKNNIQQYTTTDQNPVTIIWDYLNVDPIAKVTNAVLADVAATSFEADGTGNWTISSTLRDAVTPAITGNLSYNLSNGAISKSGLTNSNTYIISYWSRNGTYTISGGNSVGNTITGKTINGWTYYEQRITGASSVMISGGGNIDELRLYPSTAQMTTYNYAPLVGMTSQCDADNRITYYFYDGIERLKWIKDQDGNIIKTFKYHYQNQ